MRMNSEFSKSFHDIQKHIPKNQICVFNIICKDDSKNFITQDRSGKFTLYKLKDNKATTIKQSQDCLKLQHEAEQEMKKG